MYIPFHEPHLSKKTESIVKKVLESKWLTTGNYAKLFEKEIASFLRAEHVTAVSSCTAALHVAYLAVGLEPGDEVIVPSFTFCSTINMIVNTGAKPVFCDIDEQSLCLDPKDVARKISPKTKVVLAVHFGGTPADLDAIKKVTQDKNIVIIEDAAHAFTTKYKGKYIGTHGNISCFSFYATKVLTTGEGGLLTVPTSSMLTTAKTIANHGVPEQKHHRYSKLGNPGYEVIYPGYKYNLSDLHAAVGLSQIDSIEADLKKRSAIASTYQRLLGKNSNLVLPLNPAQRGSQHSWHLFTTQVVKSKHRDPLLRHLKQKGIGTSVHFIPNHEQPYYKKMFPKVRLPVTERVGSTILSLPIYPGLKPDALKYIAKAINEFLW